MGTALLGLEEKLAQAYKAIGKLESHNHRLTDRVEQLHKERLGNYELFNAGAELLATHQAKRIADLIERNATLTSALVDAVEALETWGAYAPGYFQEKHDLAGDIARIRKLTLNKGQSK